MPVVVVWLILAARIIWSASSNPETLDNIEGLLTALAVLTIPVSGGLAKVFESFGKESSYIIRLIFLFLTWGFF